MTQYVAPIRDMQFALDVAGFSAIPSLPGFEDAQPDVVAAILEEAGKFAGNALAPLRRIGDIEGCQWSDAGVSTAPGWREAWEAFRDAGWPALASTPDFGGQGLPKSVSTPVGEMWQSANMAFSLMPMLAYGAAEALFCNASDELKKRYLPKMIAGIWGGTMNLTEPNAGSDLAAVRTRAEPQADGSYRIFGQKIFITYGEHDLTENIIHLVLARLPDAPAGVKGISLFVVPKVMVNKDGSLGERNDVKCISIEHKLGIHASPTCVMSFGDAGGAVGDLVGQTNRGLEYMFVMMNEARFNVGLQGIAQGEGAYQKAFAYARERIQGRDTVSGENHVPIIRHPDVSRMLLRMKVLNQAARFIAYWVATQFDYAHAHPDPEVKSRSNGFVDLLMPVVKGWSSEVGCEVTSLGVQVHGGMGFIEETGAAQYFRDARIVPIYEGTTGIQANDLIGRKLMRDGGAAFGLLIQEMSTDVTRLFDSNNDRLIALGIRLREQVALLDSASQHLLSLGKSDMAAALSVAVPFMHLAGIVCGAWQWGRAALLAAAQDNQTRDPYFAAQAALAEFYFVHVLPGASAYGETVMMADSTVADSSLLLG
ncbi:3-methylmercaptopropionyl-CoA dehydrogenase [Georgfuchsia toluolica]|uniref:3-methylmercaptopropionyl-CoA dehydrogenase n=1 Tax=Georgfuchsia toluolica TaxID=424218 RepID=A0A916J5Q5_9PROT|nr:acyl-CoA dehydrogenase [Georgfuchsia toluolica]CAG4883665.1 3-methylmercaptopropionyl-CoA dehydrogenase [Georgfuchsia toluolica]